jgi:GH25 family lysozyme M1 (1,4-beta-N-acetylmuramidase)/predicted glycosyl hydrolase (DUF1957 family)
MKKVIGLGLIFFVLISSLFAVSVFAATPLSATATASKTTVNVGDSITFTAKGSGGSGSYQYKFGSSLPNGSWKVWQDKSSKNTYTFTPKASDGFTKTTSFNFAIDVIDTATGKYTTKWIWITVYPQLGVSVTANKTTVTVGDSITFTAKGSGGSGSYQYKFGSSLPNGSWKVWQDKSSKNTYTFTPKASDGFTKQTSFNFAVDVFDTATGKYVTQMIWITVKPSASPLSMTASANKTTVTVGDSITFTAKGSGGSGSYQYKFGSSLPNGSWKVWQDKSSKNTYTFTPKASDGFTKTTSFNFAINVFDAATGDYVTQWIWITVKPSSTAPLSMTASANKTTVTVGDSITFTAKGSGGSGSYQYKFGSSLPDGSWKVWQDKSSKNTYTFTPKASDGFTKQTSFNFAINVFDAATGDYVTQWIWITVKPSTTTPLSMTASANKTTVTVGDSITFTAQGSGGSGSYQYKFGSSLPNGSWKVWQDKSSKNTYTFTPKASDGFTKTTSFNFAIDVFDTSTGKYVSQMIWITVNPVNSPLSMTASVNNKTVTVGNSITFTAQGSGGSGSYQYKFGSSLPNGSWKVWQDKSSKNTYTFTPKASDGFTKTTSFNFAIDVFDTSTGKYVTQMIWITVLPEGTNEQAIDVSYANAYVDWAKVRASGISKAILRIGFTGYGSYSCTLDARFEENYKNATANGVQVGVYFFSYAISPDKDPQKSLQLARNEANFCVSQLKGKNISLPVVYDIEDLAASNPKLSSLGRDALTNNVLEFCRIIKEAGYTPMLYASPAYIRSYLDYDRIWAADIPLWIANYTSAETYSFPYPAYMWQYTSTGSVSGVSGNVDVNRVYPDNLVAGESYMPKPLGACTSDGTNVRSGPSTDYSILYQVNSGYKFSIIGESGNWYQISFGGGRTGWISKSYSKKL